MFLHVAEGGTTNGFEGSFLASNFPGRAPGVPAGAPTSFPLVQVLGLSPFLQSFAGWEPRHN